MSHADEVYNIHSILDLLPSILNLCLAWQLIISPNSLWKIKPTKYLRSVFAVLNTSSNALFYSLVEYALAQLGMSHFYHISSYFCPPSWPMRLCGHTNANAEIKWRIRRIWHSLGFIICHWKLDRSMEENENHLFLLTIRQIIYYNIIFVMTQSFSPDNHDVSVKAFACVRVCAYWCVCGSAMEKCLNRLKATSWWNMY